MALEPFPLSPLQTILSLLLILTLLKTTQLTLQHRRRRLFAQKNGCYPPPSYPDSFPYLGLPRLSASSLARKNNASLPFIHSQYHQLQTHTFSFTLPTLDRIIATAEPQNAKAIFNTQFADFATGGRLALLGPLIGKGIFTADGEDWKHSRAMIRPNFVRKQVADVEGVEEHLKDMFELLPRDGTTVDLQPLFFGLTLDTATEFLFGTSVRSLRGEEEGRLEGTAFVKAYDAGLVQCGMRATPSLWKKMFPQSSEDKRNCKLVREFVQPYVDQALEWRRDGKGEKEAPGGKYTFLYELAKETGDAERMRDEVLNLLLAGRDTTASLLGSMFFHLAKRPDVWGRLREEVGRVEGRKPSFEELKDMKVLQWCMKETLRVNTVVPVVMRCATKDTTLPVGGGKDGKSPIFVHKGQVVFTHFGTMHLREDIWGPDAATWNPDRWATARPGAWDYLPFSGGPRVCVGQQYALTEAGYVTARMVQTFPKLVSRDEGPWKERFMITCASFQTLVSLTRD